MEFVMSFNIVVANTVSQLVSWTQLVFSYRGSLRCVMLRHSHTCAQISPILISLGVFWLKFLLEFIASPPCVWSLWQSWRRLHVMKFLGT